MRYLYLSAFILIIGYLGFLSPIKNLFQGAFSPFQFGLRELATNTREGFIFFSNVSKLKSENVSLIQENLSLRSQITELKKLSDENDLLRSQLNLKKPSDSQLLLASIMGNSSDLTGSTFVLDKGSVNGVKTGDMVVRESYLVGIVTQVGKYRSTANFISSSAVSMAVMDLDAPTKTEGIAEGQFGSSIIIKRILPNEDIRVGDSIVTSGKDGIFKPGFLVGKVTKVQEVPTETLKSAYMETFIDLSKVDKAFILAE